MGVQLYRITQCCNLSNEATFVIGDGNAMTPTGWIPPLNPQTLLPWVGGTQTVQWVGATTTIGGVDFNNGYCYTVTFLGSGSPTTNVIPDPATNLSLLNVVPNMPGTGTCQDSICTPCDPDFPIPPSIKLVFTPCCDDYPLLEFAASAPGTEFLYEGLVMPTAVTAQAQAGWSIVTQTGGTLPEFGQCYHVTPFPVTPAEYALLPTLPPFNVGTTFDGILDSTIPQPCTDPVAALSCPSCTSVCFRVVSCDGTQDFMVTSLPNVYGNSDISNYANQFVTLIDNDFGTPIAGTYFVLYVSGWVTDCNGALSNISVAETLPEPCDCQCYEISGDFVDVTYVDCDNKIMPNVYTTQFCSRIYPIVTPLPQGTAPTIVQGGDCVDGECPVNCYLLENCVTGELMQTLSDLHIYYNLNQIVTLDGYEGCWKVLDGSCQCIEVTIDGTTVTAQIHSSYNDKFTWQLTFQSTIYYIWWDSATSRWRITQALGVITSPTQLGYMDRITDCPTADNTIWVGDSLPNGNPVTSIDTVTCENQCNDCPVNVTVLTAFDDCITCTGVIAYRLQKCDDPTNVLYTTTDLSQHVDKSIEIDCGCYLVELINFAPPVDTPITVLYSFDSCVKCQTRYYKLTDCLDDSIIIYTSTNLSAYINSIIKIESCKNCWTVEETREPGIVETVVFSQEYVDCITCNIDLPCICNKITNLTTDRRKTIEYYDCNGEVQEITLAAGATSDKFCMKAYKTDVVADPGVQPEFYVEEFGNCQNGVCPHPVFVNNRTVKPGYNTPICSAEKYDKITCNFADVIYKVVLEKRYGISNCCPEDDQKWIIKKLLIDMQALKDTCYPCSKTNSCKCGNSSTCSSCNCKN